MVPKKIVWSVSLAVCAAGAALSVLFLTVYPVFAQDSIDDAGAEQMSEQVLFVEETSATTTQIQLNADDRIPRAEEVYKVQALDGEQNFGDFVVGPGKFDLTIAPGEEQIVTITVANRTGEEKVFSFTTEDVTGSNDLETPTVLLGDDRGPYTLRDFISVPAPKVIIEPNTIITVPVTVKMPIDAEPGGRYGSLLVQTTSRGDSVNNAPSTAVVSRIAVLFFVTTPGDLERSGQLVDFYVIPPKVFYTSGPITFGLLYENTGNVHTTPAGEIMITNMFGKELGYIEVVPWFSLPQSLRLREVVWDRETLLGRYTATTRVYRGYGDEYDTATVTFWVINPVLLAVFVGGVLVIWFVIRWLTRNIQIVRRQP